MDKFIQTASLFAVLLLMLFVANSLHGFFNELTVDQYKESLQTNHEITPVSPPNSSVLPVNSLSIIELTENTDKKSKRILTGLFEQSWKDHQRKFFYYIVYSKQINPGLSFRELIFPFHSFL